MNVSADIIDPDDVMYLEKFVSLNKRFTLTWDDIIRKGMEEWDKIGIKVWRRIGIIHVLK